MDQEAGAAGEAHVSSWLRGDVKLEDIPLRRERLSDGRFAVHCVVPAEKELSDELPFPEPLVDMRTLKHRIADLTRRR